MRQSIALFHFQAYIVRLASIKIPANAVALAVDRIEKGPIRSLPAFHAVYPQKQGEFTSVQTVSTSHKTHAICQRHYQFLLYNRVQEKFLKFLSSLRKFFFRNFATSTTKVRNGHF